MGGGIYCANATPIITGNSLVDNSGYNGGGGIYCLNSSALITNNVVSRNRASDGGGVRCVNSQVILDNDVFAGNHIPDSLGGGAEITGTATINNCVFVGNYTNHVNYSHGAGVWISGNATVTNCTFVANSSPGGAGLYNAGGAVNVKLINCILWGNTGPALGGSMTATYSCVQGGWSGLGNLNNNPEFVRLPKPGADNDWGTADDDYGDLRLNANSPCIDAGQNAAVPGGTRFDLGGYPRFLDDPATYDCSWAADTCGIAPVVDMGAYEFLGPIAADFDGDHDVDSIDLSRFQACITGAAIRYNPAALPTSPPGCALIPDGSGHIAADFNADGIVDQYDFAVFQRCYNGKDRLADPSCAN